MARAGSGSGDPVTLGPWELTRRGARVARAAITAVTVLALVALTLLVSAGILTDGDYYEQSLGDADAYDRFYTEVLADPEFADTRKRLVANLPVDESLLTSNLRVVIPPATLRALVGSTVDSITEYLRAERDNIDLGVAVQPLVDNVKQIADHYLTDAIVNTESFEAQDLGQFGDAALRFFSDLENGRTPSLLPTIPLTPETSESVARIISGYVPPEQRVESEPRIRAALAVGDLNGAMATAAVEKVQLGEDEAHGLLTLDIGDDGEVDFTASVDALEGTTAATIMQHGRLVLGTVLPLALVGLALLVAAGLGLIAFITGRLGGGRVRQVGLVLIVGGVLAGVVWGAARLFAPDLSRRC